jgi:hypothetical protein
LVPQITANFRHFVAYSTGSSSIVLMGDIKTTPDTDPSIIPELQNRDVISVAIGDYHYAALTLTGKVLTWGQYSKGALGLGDPVDIEIGKPGGMASEEQRAFSRTHRMGAPPPPVKVPTEVRFDHTRRRAGGGEDKFCFAVTAAGWHTGALVIDLEVRGPPRLLLFCSTDIPSLYSRARRTKGRPPPRMTTTHLGAYRDTSRPINRRSRLSTRERRRVILLLEAEVWAFLGLASQGGLRIEVGDSAGGEAYKRIRWQVCCTIAIEGWR